VKYTIEIDDNCPPIEPHEFANMPEAAEYCIGYVNDEYAENPEPGVAANGKPFLKRDLYAAVGALSSGFARGGNFSVVFQGEAIKVRCQYDSLYEMMAVLAQGEKFAADQDRDDGCSHTEIDDYMQERLATVAKYGNPNAPWQMTVYEWMQDGSDSLHGPFNKADCLYVGKGEVSWESAQGVVTMWQGE